jgi:hypothetical protein
MNAHFFDINTLITIDSEVWIVSKTNPSGAIAKISLSDFNLIKKGVFKKNNEYLKLGNKKYYLPTDTINDIKVRCKKMNIDITSLSFSMQEFINPEVIENLNSKIWKEHFIDLKNTNDDIYIICPENSKEIYEKLIKKLEENLFEIGISVKNFYFFNENLYTKDSNKLYNNKIKLLIQHLIGLKTEVDRFTDEEIEKYDIIYYYDDDQKSIDLGRTSNDILKFLTDNSEESIKPMIKDVVKTHPILILNKSTFNKVNRFIKYEVILNFDRIIKTYESFRLRF